jgi:hypothetical protein
MHQEIFERLVIQQVVREAGAIIEAKDLMDAGVTEIGVDRGEPSEPPVARLTGIHRSQRLASPWPGLVTPNTFNHVLEGAA